MSDLKDDEVIDPNRLRPRELLIRIYEKVQRLEENDKERAKSEIETKLKINTLEVDMNNRTKTVGTIWGLIAGTITGILSALATKLFG